MLKNLIAIGLFVCTLAFVGCSSEKEDIEGDWPAIQVTVNGEHCKSLTYTVPADGGEFKIFSKNYGSVWLISIQEDKERVWPEDYDWSDYLNINFARDWYSVRCDESKNIVVTIQPKSQDSPSRNVHLELECGDAFSHIDLRQK